MRGAAAATLLAILLLAGCSGAKTRSPHAAGTSVSPGRGTDGGAGNSTARAGRSADNFRDDINRPQSSRYRDNSDSVPGAVPDVSKLVEPIPRIEPRSLYGNKSPYTVLGKSYRVLSSARGYDERGIASFYGNKFHGYKTSSLETYDMYAFSAASTTLPLPSYARVTNLENGKSVVVRVNDRGPFHENRLIDLSYAAAVKIGIWPKGTGLVEVRGIDPGGPTQELPPPRVVRAGHPGIFLQVGAFSDASNAERLAQRLRQAKLGDVQIQDAQVNGHHVHRVRIGPLSDVDQADQVSARIEALGLPPPQVAVD